MLKLIVDNSKDTKFVKKYDSRMIALKILKAAEKLNDSDHNDAEINAFLISLNVTGRQ